MHSYQLEFINLALKCNALRFGEFTLKSGRSSPYFFNAGEFRTGQAISVLGNCYAQALLNSGIPFDMLFGPAYKGIPLATATAISLANTHSLDVPYAFNRKEAKDHGEGGQLIGAPIKGKIAIVDDVITAGTAVREVLTLIKAVNAEPAVVLVGLNRQEKGRGHLSAIQELEQECGVPVVSIINLENVMEYLQTQGETSTLEAVQVYRQKYGV